MTGRHSTVNRGKAISPDMALTTGRASGLPCVLNGSWSRSRTVLLAIGLCTVVGIRCTEATAQNTEVTIFHPAVPSGPKRSGECWTDSIAVARAGVWRCMVDNEIYDPCFSSPGLNGAVICGANPASKEPGFVLELTKPLPKPSTPGLIHPRPWLVQLSDGTVCEIQTGTIASVKRIDVPYGCSDSHQCTDSGCPYMTGLTAKFARGKVWMAEKITYGSSDKGLKLLGRKRVAVTAVWN